MSFVLSGLAVTICIMVQCTLSDATRVRALTSVMKNLQAIYCFSTITKYLSVHLALLWRYLVWEVTNRYVYTRKGEEILIRKTLFPACETSHSPKHRAGNRRQSVWRRLWSRHVHLFTHKVTQNTIQKNKQDSGVSSSWPQALVNTGQVAKTKRDSKGYNPSQDSSVAHVFVLFIQHKQQTHFLYIISNTNLFISIHIMLPISFILRSNLFSDFPVIFLNCIHI